MVRPGRSFPPGATVQAAGTNFCVFSRNCNSVELLLDPYTKSVAVPSTYRPEYAIEDGDNAAMMMKSVVDLSR